MLSAIFPPRTALSLSLRASNDDEAPKGLMFRLSKSSRLWKLPSVLRNSSKWSSMLSQLKVMSSSMPASQKAWWTASSTSSSGSLFRRIRAISSPLTVPEWSVSMFEKTLRAFSTHMSLYLDCSTCQSIWLARNCSLVILAPSSPRPICCRRWIASVLVTWKPIAMSLSASSPTSMSWPLNSSLSRSSRRTSMSEILSAGSSGSE
mmetsp:Transcript_28200/g.66973  ORF Transcript_28200/g.66973 Transcript_28200/m.66973 type:complete len:205 (+) Transcript_28200:161-775(+)